LPHCVSLAFKTVLYKNSLTARWELSHPHPFITLGNMSNAILNLTTNKAMTPSLADQRWQSVLVRDSTQDGNFVFAVSSTGIYCRPSCPARRPRRENVEFFSHPAKAEKAGYRACLRCHPQDGGRNRKTVTVQAICRFIEEHSAQPVTLAYLSKAFHLSPFHLQRLFKSATGITPRVYADTFRRRELRKNLHAGHSVTRAILDSGYNSASRIYRHSALGMSPGAYRDRGLNLRLRYAIADCPLGRLLLAATDKGICAIHLGASDSEVEASLKEEFSRADCLRDDTAFRSWTNTLQELIAGRAPRESLPLDIQATVFQRQVWDYLQTIPPGTTQTYNQVATAIGRPAAIRAVAHACASNRISVAIPCHRVIRKDGGLGGYRWGLQRKTMLLNLEASRNSE
jgi:AraC family transcriptional regulator of adaptative response/methylated-DNA-[protein]-cysteine methyltransferase